MSQPLARAPEVADHRIGTVLAEFEVTSEGSPIAAPETLAQKVRLELLPALEDVFAHPQITGHHAVIEALEIDLGAWPDDPDWSAVRSCFRERMLSALAPYLRRASLPSQGASRATGLDDPERVHQTTQAQTGVADPSEMSSDDGVSARPSVASATERFSGALWASGAQRSAASSEYARAGGPSVLGDQFESVHDTARVGRASAPTAERQTSAALLQAARKRDPSAYEDLLGSLPDAAHRALLEVVSAGDEAEAAPGLRALEHVLQAVFVRSGHPVQTARGFAAQMVVQLLVRPAGSALAAPLPGEQPDDVVSTQNDGKAPISGRPSVGHAPAGQSDLQDLKAGWSRDPERVSKTFAALDVPGLLALIQSLFPVKQDAFGAALDGLVQRSKTPKDALVLVLRAVLDGRPIDLEEIEADLAAASPELHVDAAVTEEHRSDHGGIPPLWHDVLARLTGDPLPPGVSTRDDHTDATSAVRSAAQTATSGDTSKTDMRTGKTGQIGVVAQDVDQADPGRAPANANTDDNNNALPSARSSDETMHVPEASTDGGAAAEHHPDKPRGKEASTTQAAKGSQSLSGASAPPHSGSVPPGQSSASAKEAQPDLPRPATDGTPKASRSGVTVRERIDLPGAVDVIAEVAFGPAAKDLREMLDLAWGVLDAETRGAALRRRDPQDVVAERAAEDLDTTYFPQPLLLELIARAGPGPTQLDEVLTHLLGILEPLAKEQAALVRQMIARLGYAAAGVGAPVARDRLRAGLEAVLRAKPSTTVAPGAMGLTAAEGAAQRLLTQQAGLVLLHPFLKLLFSRLELLLGPGDMIASDNLPRARAVLQMLSGSPASKRNFDPLVRLLLGMTDDMPPPAVVDLSDTDAALIDGLLRSVIAQWSKLGQTSPKGLQEAFLRRSGQIRFDSAGAHLRVDPGPFDILLDGLPWAVDTTIALPWMTLPCHVSWRSQDG